MEEDTQASVSEDSKNSSDDSSQDSEESNEERKSVIKFEFAQPRPIRSFSKHTDDKFKKPVLIGPRKHKKLLASSSHVKLPDFKSPEEKPKSPEEIERDTVGSSVIVAPSEREELTIPSSPLVISDFSDKVLPSEFPYNEPPWKGLPEDNFYLEELKSGVIEKEIELTGRSYTVMGRLDCCHVTMAHPTISRYHAVLQYRATRTGIYDKGFYLYDLASTHGTFLNKNRIKPQTFVRIHVGHMMKFGCSTRMYILQGPDEDQEPESEHTVTELVEMRRQKLEERAKEAETRQRLKEEEEERERKKRADGGVDWGMSEDAEEETDLTENPFAVTTNEEVYSEDPKKELKKWFEREGEELNYDTEQVERGKMVCRVTLPLDNGKGGDVVIESTGKSKKEVTVSCALEACRYIDRLGLFRQANREAKKRQVRDWEENDFYDSDEDNYFDRTGDLDEKRRKRMEKAGKLAEKVETYESLVESHRSLVEEIASVERKYAEMTQVALGVSHGDDLDQYMRSLKHQPPNKLEVKMCQVQLNNLKREETRLVSLIDLAKPADLPRLKPFVPSKPASQRSQNPPEESARPTLDKPENTSPSCVTDPLTKLDESSTKVADESVRRSVIGPVLPTEENAAQENAAEGTVKRPRKNRVRQRQHNPKVSDTLEKEGSDCYSDLTWQPPEGQSGDGRTSLNDKYGY